MKLTIIEEYNVLDEVAETIEVGEYNEETGEYFNCTLYSVGGKMLAQYRYFTKEDIPKHEVISLEN